MIPTLNYIALAISLVMVLHLFRAPLSKPVTNRLMTAALLVIAVQSWLMSHGALPTEGFPVNLMPVQALLIGPLWLATFQSASDHIVFSWLRFTTHLVPPFALAVLILSGVKGDFIDFLVLSSFLLYSLCLVRIAMSGRLQFSSLGQASHVVFGWLVGCAVLLLFALITDGLILFELCSGTELYSSIALHVATWTKVLVLAWLLILALDNPMILNWYQAIPNRLETKLDPHEKEQLERLNKNFVSLVSEHKLYLDDDVSLKGVANQLNVPMRQLSRAINLGHQQSFSKYMNGCRVAEAKQLLAKYPGKEITNIMFEAGFRTKSSFNREFRAIEQMSPSEYRAQLKRHSK